MTDGLEEAEQMEKSVQHIIDLLNPVDQSLNECKAVMARMYAGAPPVAQARVAKVGDAIKDVESVLAQMVTYHNTLAGELRALQDELKSHAAATPDPEDLGF